MAIHVGIVGAGNRGQSHAQEYEAVDGASVAAVADIDEAAATDLAETHDATAYADFRDMLDDAALDAVSVCVHNNLHRPVAVAAAEAGCHVFCEKPMAATYADAKAMADAADEAGVELGVQNVRIFYDGTQTARRLDEAGRLGETYYARGVYSRRRGRPYVDGYGTPSFVTQDAAGGGPVLDVGTYVVGQLLYLLGNADVERVSGQTFEYTDDAYAPKMVGDNRETYTERLDESGYDVEDAGVGVAHLADGSVLELRSAWHMFLPDRPSVVAGSQGGVQLDPFEFYTTTEDYKATVDLDVDNYERRQALLESESGYGGDREDGQFAHWIHTLDGTAENPIPTGDIALNSMRVLEGIYFSAEESREFTAAEIAERSTSSAVDL